MLETLVKANWKVYNGGKPCRKRIAMNSSNLAGSEYLIPGENFGDRDNQQERLKRIIWIAAMLEAEGTFTFQYNEQYKNGGLHSHIQPRTIFVNSDFVLVDRVESELRALGSTTYRRRPFRTGMGNKFKSEVQVNGFKVLPLLLEILPFVYGSKSEVIRCLIDFIQYRKSLKQPKQRYYDYEFGLLRRVREINSGSWKTQPKFSSISSTTVRQRRELAWKEADAKIQSGLHGDMQSAAEMTAPLSARKLSRRSKLYADDAKIA